MIVCYGEALVDLYALPLGASIEAATRFEPRFGGAPANVALTLGRLGCPTRFVGAVGRDAHGTRLVETLRGAAVCVRAVQRRSERTGITFVRVRDDSRAFLFYRDRSADASLDIEALERSCALEEVDTLIVGSSALVNDALRDATRWLLERCEGARLVVDLNARPHLWRDVDELRRACEWLVARAHVVKASDDDLRALGWGDAPDALLRRAPGGAIVALTRGAKGAELALGSRRWRADALPVRCVDATGAGDAFTAGLVAALRGARWDVAALEGALAFATELGGRAVTEVGATDALGTEWLRERATQAGLTASEGAR